MSNTVKVWRIVFLTNLIVNAAMNFMIAIQF